MNKSIRTQNELIFKTSFHHSDSSSQNQCFHFFPHHRHQKEKHFDEKKMKGENIDFKNEGNKKAGAV